VPRRPLLDRQEQLVENIGSDKYTDDQLKLGRELYYMNCAGCHESGRAPKLIPLKVKVEQEVEDIVMKGSRLPKGMPGYTDILSKEQMYAILAYIKAGESLKID